MSCSKRIISKCWFFGATSTAPCFLMQVHCSAHHCTASLNLLIVEALLLSLSQLSLDARPLRPSLKNRGEGCRPDTTDPLPPPVHSPPHCPPLRHGDPEIGETAFTADNIGQWHHCTVPPGPCVSLPHWLSITTTTTTCCTKPLARHILSLPAIML